MGPHFRIERATTYSLEIHILPLRSFLLFQSIDTKILMELQSKKMNETVLEDYCPTDKPTSVSLPCTSFSACKGHYLLSKSCYTVSCFLVSIQQLYPKQALWVQNDLLCALRKNSEGWYSTTSIFVGTAKRNGGFRTWKIFWMSVWTTWNRC